MIIAAALLPLLAMMGGGFDMGRAYLVQARLQQACDSGVLAARKRLGSESIATGDVPDDVALIGDRFFNANFAAEYYGTTDRDFTMTLGEDYAISGVATSTLPTQVMGIFGKNHFDIIVDCSAQLNFANTDVMMVLDVTGSMAITNPGDSGSRMAVLKDTIKTFHTQLEAATMAGTRVRYGFVPYSTNVNVGHLLQDDWVVGSWGYQSRELKVAGGAGKTSFYSASSPVSGTNYDSVKQTYAAVLSGGAYSCPTKPADNLKTSTVKVSERTETVVGPPAGTRTIATYDRTRNGETFKVSLDGKTCTVIVTTFGQFIDTYDYITEPTFTNGKWLYDRLKYDVANWRTAGNGCMEERQTYEITDYSNVDFSKALDLNLDLVPTDDLASQGVTAVESLSVTQLSGLGSATLPAGSVTRWRPMFPSRIYARELEWNGAGAFKKPSKLTDKEYVSPMLLNTDACPAPAAKLAPMTSGELDAYLATLVPMGSTYHDIGMIWGGRLISPTGLFAAENQDLSPSSPTNRNLIFLTDGLTAPLDLSYSSYGMEPIDQRRWSPSSSLTLSEVVEKRFGVACNEVKKRGVTVWVIGFGVGLSDTLKECAGDGHYFEADDAAELNASFASIAKTVSDLRIVN